ncbi:MAG: FAD:protein FMN transferase [Nitrospirales bacterium]|nr:FAD:protein FMN transferase [Nitrospira sp.]MDR4500332.1 FAD:protein FMN transferase [Nitrospirales bacterium]
MCKTKLCQCLLACFFVSLLDVGLAFPALVKRSQYLMGTIVFVTGVAPDNVIARRAVDAGLKEIHRLEELWSTWIPDSELSNVNAAAGEHAIAISHESMELLQHSFTMDVLTEGGFTIAIGPAVALWNVSEQGRIPTQQELQAVRPLVQMSHLTLNARSGTAYLVRPGMQIDVGGIGKGYAADLAEKVMKAAGATAGVVAISGDIKTFGRMPDGQQFVFGIQHPRKEQGHVLATIELEDEAVSTAGDYQRYFEKDGIRYHHILDPKTLHPARLTQSVTVIASQGVMADGLDTGIFVMGPQRGMALIERLPDVEGVIVDAEGNVSVSSGLKGRLHFQDHVLN